MKNIISYTLFDLNCNHGSTAAALYVICNVEVIYTGSGNDNLTKLITERTVIDRIYANGVYSIVCNSKAKVNVMCCGVILIGKVEINGFFIPQSTVCSRSGNTEITEHNLCRIVCRTVI